MLSAKHRGHTVTSEGVAAMDRPAIFALYGLTENESETKKVSDRQRTTIDTKALSDSQA
jgi:hypothetical protein